MSRLTLLAAALALAGGVIGVLGYRKASQLEDELRRARSHAVAPPERDDDAAIDRALQRLDARIDALEARSRGASPATAAAPPPPISAPAVAPTAAISTTPEPPSPTDPLPPRNEEMRDPAKRPAYAQRVVATIDAYWRDWGTRNGLTAQQIDSLAAAQIAAARRKLDNQAKMMDGQITQPAARADNAAATDEVRQKARALLSAEQLTQFEAEKGAEIGSSVRRVREAAAKAAATPP